MTQLQRFKKSLAENGFDGAIISSEINQRYLCDFPFSDGYILVGADKSYLLTDFRYVEAINAKVKNFEILCPENGMSNCLAELISSANMHRIAVEEDSISLAQFEAFSKKLKKISLLVGH